MCVARTGLLFLLLLLSRPASASLMGIPWLEPMLLADDSAWPVTSLANMPGLYDCGLQPEQQFCSEPVDYYGVTVESNLWLTNGSVSKLELTAPFSHGAYSGLISNLRKDGFVLAKVEINQQVIDVAQKLQSMPVYKVDREVIVLMNRRPLSSPRQLLWVPATEFSLVKPTRSVQFVSSSSGIRLIFFRH